MKCCRVEKSLKKTSEPIHSSQLGFNETRSPLKSADGRNDYEIQTVHESGQILYEEHSE